MSQFIKFYFTSTMLDMFRKLMHPSSGVCDFSIVSPHWLCVLVSLCVGVSMWLVGVVSVRPAEAAVVLQPATRIPLQPSHTETPTHIETRTHNQCGDTIEKSQVLLLFIQLHLILLPPPPSALLLLLLSSSISPPSPLFLLLPSSFSSSFSNYPPPFSHPLILLFLLLLLFLLILFLFLLPFLFYHSYHHHLYSPLLFFPHSTLSSPLSPLLILPFLFHPSSSFSYSFSLCPPPSHPLPPPPSPSPLVHILLLS